MQQTQIIKKEDFQNKPEWYINNWISLNRNLLCGSAVFTVNDSAVSKIVRLAEKRKCPDKEFIPAHTGSIILYKNDLYLFNMKPLKASVILLKDYILTTTDNWRLVLRDFELDSKMFSLNIAEHIGEFYPFMSAVCSVFSKRQSKWRRHCSELHLRELQKQGILTNLNPEITPDELWHAMAGFPDGRQK